MCARMVVSTSPFLQRAHADGALDVSIISEPEGDPAGVYQAATPATLNCTCNGSSSATYSWTCSGDSNCFTQGLTQPSKRRVVLRGGDTGTHICTVFDGGMTGNAATNVTITGNHFQKVSLEKVLLLSFCIHFRNWF